MANNNVNVKEFVEYIVRAICDNKDKVEIEEIKGDRTISLNIKCDKNDIGKVIGKKGHVANAIRTLAQHISFSSGSRISITVID